jgi:glycosyltransferase involved in cell wall biosynthesis
MASPPAGLTPAPAGRVPISAVVMTKNEAINLPDCLAALAWADERLVVDSFSTDATVALAQQAGVRVVQHAFENYAAQRNFAQAQAAHDWILFIDADERVTPALAAEIQALAASGRLAEANAYHIQRVHLISGQWFTTPPDRPITPRLRAAIRRYEVPRLYDRRLAVWERDLHEVVQVPEPHGVLAGALCHYASTNLSIGLESFNNYTDIEAAYLYRQGRRTSVVGAAWRGLRAAVFHYVVEGWWRSGEHGLMLALVAGVSKFMNYLKLWELQRIAGGRGLWTDRDRALLPTDAPADEPPQP